MQRVWVGSLVRELISHLPCGQKTQNIKERQYCDKFNKDLKKKKEERNWRLREVRSPVRGQTAGWQFPALQCSPQRRVLFENPINFWLSGHSVHLVRESSNSLDAESATESVLCQLNDFQRD